MEQVIGNISTEWGFYALALYLGIELMKSIFRKIGSKKKNEKTATAVLDKLDSRLGAVENSVNEHIKIDKAHQMKTDKAFLRLEYLRLNSEDNISKNFDTMCKIFQEYKALNGNGYIHEIHEQNIIKYRNLSTRKRGRSKIQENENK